MFSNEVAQKLVAATSAKLSGSLRMALSGPNILKVHLTRALEELMGGTQQNNCAQLSKLQSKRDCKALHKHIPVFPNRKWKQDAVFEMAGGHAIIRQRAYPKATLQAVLGVRESLVYFITGATAHPGPI